MAGVRERLGGELMQVNHRLVVWHPSREAFVVSTHGGRPRLPALVTEDRHTAEVDHLNAGVFAQFRLTTAVLASLSHSSSDEWVQRAHALESQSGDELADRGLIWWPAARHADLEDAADRDAVARWLAQRGPVIDGRDWMVAGFGARARAWIADRLGATGAGAPFLVEQLRAWQSSTVLRVRAGPRTCYFKAVATSLRHECALTAWLAARFPGQVADVVAADAERRWMLMAACDGSPLDAPSADASGPLVEADGIERWLRAARQYGAMQVSCMAHVDELRALGCAWRRLDELATAIANLLRDDAAILTGGEEPLTAEEHARFRVAVPDLVARCASLAAVSLPPTIDHGDLWPGNFLVDDTHCALIDWEDAAISHPFLSLAPLRVGLMQRGGATDADLARLDAAYLSAFAGLKSAAMLESALRDARPLSFMDMALRYGRQRPSVARQHPWMADLVPQAVRLALAALE